MTTVNDEEQAVLVRIAALTPAQTDVYKSKLNDDLAEDVFKELLDVTRLPPAHCQFRPSSTPNLEALAMRWVAEQPGDPLPWLLRQATHSVQNGDHRRQLRIIMQTGKARGSVDSDVSQRDRDAGVAAGNRKRCLVPALAGGIVLALECGPRLEYRSPDPPDPEEVEELFALFADDRRAKAVDLLERELGEAGQALPRWREWVGPVWAWWWHPAGQPAAKFRFLHDDAAVKRAAWMTTEFEANRIAITKSPPIISDHSHFDLGALPITHHFVKETERSTMQRWERWKPRNSPFLLDVNRFVWPGFLAMHAVIQTCDGWLIISHRQKSNPDLKYPSYFPDSWSLSFEEQADPSSKDNWAGDQTVADVAIRGLREEFRLVCSEVQVQCHLIGRECVPIPPIPNVQDGFVLNAAAFCTIRVDEDVHDVWRNVPRAEDVGEHRDFLAIRLETEDHLRHALRATKIEELVTDPNRIRFYLPTTPRSGPLRWHPTSRARLALWGLDHLHR